MRILSEPPVHFRAMLNPVDLQFLRLVVNPIEDPIVADTQAAEADEIARHIRELMVDHPRRGLAEPDYSSKNSPTNLGIETFGEVLRVNRVLLQHLARVDPDFAQARADSAESYARRRFDCRN